MKVGDLVVHTPSDELGLIVQADEWWSGGYTLVKWFDELGDTEDVELYEGELEVVK